MSTTILEAIEADFAALEQTTSLIYQLYARCLHVRDSSGDAELNARVALAADVWAQLDELGVDLRIDDLKTALVARTATAPKSGGTAAPRYASALWEERVDPAPPDAERRAM